MKTQSLSYYLNKAKTLTSHNSGHLKKISILSNFTLNGISETLKVMSNEEQMDIEVYEGPYNQFRQEILNTKSQWYNFKPDLSFIILDFGSLIGNIQFQFYSLEERQREKIISQTCNEINDLIKVSLGNQSGKIVFSNFSNPSFSPLGIFDAKLRYSIRDFVNSLNNTIRDLVLSNNSLFVLDLDSFFLEHGQSNITDEKFRYLADMKISPSFLPLLAGKMMSFIKPLFGKTRKCLVVDLDNTLWGGIIGEDGLRGIQLDSKPPGNCFVELQKVILELYNRGVILAINSKNNADDVKEVFEKHPNMILKENHFAVVRINWDNKASNMVSIAKELNIGTDSMVYLDDDPVNRELIRQNIPEVLVVDLPNDPSLYVKTLKNLNDFNTFQITEEDRKKGEMYVQQRQRSDLEKKFTDMGDFLASLEMKVIVKKADNFTIPRISQLTMKTNQFNLTTRRYSEEDITKMAKDQNFVIKTFSVKDKFGDNGLTGLYIVKKENPKNWKIDTFLMSCRVMGRNIEDVMLADLVEEAKKENVEQIIGEYIPTKKNELTKDLYLKYGFSKLGNSTFVLRNLSTLIVSQNSFIKKEIAQ